MSDDYVVDGVTVTPQPGGFYNLSHPSLQTPERVRGKETADARAKEIAAAAAEPEGSMEPQPSIDDVAIPTSIPASDAPVAPAVEMVKPAEPASELDQLKDIVARQQAMIDALLAQPATTVMTAGEPVAAPDPLRTVPREFTGQATEEQRTAMSAIGVEYVTIVLEESSDIPPTGLYIGHNGRGYMIRPGEQVDVPDFLLGVLDDAVMSSPVVDSKSQKVLGYRNRTKYPYRRV